METLLEIDNLKTYFYLDNGIAKVIDGVFLEIEKGNLLSLVGESGCGKTMLALSILNLVPPPGKIVEGEINFEGKNLRSFSEKDWQTLRGKEFAMVFQEPLTSLNPVLSIGYQMTEMLNFHLKMDKKEAQIRAIELLEEVGLSNPQIVFKSYPHKLSGGMLQRVMIAMSLSCHPKLLILDEPTTALDTTIQAQILDLILKIKNETQLTIILITHDLAIVEELADEIAIMYSGKIVELAKTKELLYNPVHPYTQGLLACVPKMDNPKGFLKTIPGQVIDPINKPLGCPFYSRCERRSDICIEKFPDKTKIVEKHWVWCHHL